MHTYVRGFFFCGVFSSPQKMKDDRRDQAATTIIVPADAVSATTFCLTASAKAAFSVAAGATVSDV